ncbi:hypothetical protein BASA81_000851 [Batrachochytrium salamandrivorans]|nr:hypothetical protein BASA81_000851 [Batrachochytrium salamandrivorans]
MYTSESSAARRTPMPSAATGRLKAWFVEHQDNPYPTVEQKQVLLSQLDITESQLKNWLANARKRNWTPIRLGVRPPQNDFEKAFVRAPPSTFYEHAPVGGDGDVLDDLVLPESYFDNLAFTPESTSPVEPESTPPFEPERWHREGEDLLNMDLQEIDLLLVVAMGDGGPVPTEGEEEGTCWMRDVFSPRRRLTVGFQT